MFLVLFIHFILYFELPDFKAESMNKIVCCDMISSAGFDDNLKFDPHHQPI